MHFSGIPFAIVPFLLLGICASPGAASRYPRYEPIRRICAVDEPSDTLRDSHQWLQSNEPLENELWNGTLVQERYVRYIVDHSTHGHERRQTPTVAPIYTIDTYIHIVADTASASPLSPDYVTDTMIQNQFKYLNGAYRNASIAYRLMGIDRSTNDTWAANGDDLGMKRSLRRGSYSSLNIYYQSQLQSTVATPGVPAGSLLLGFCSLPAAGVTSSTPRDNYVIDGCNILSGTMPGGNVGGYNLGGTTAHEVGHWNGLLHTFNGGTCDVGDFGDFVADTPQEASSTNGCPATKDTCPTSGVAAGAYNGLPGQGANPYGPQGYSGPDPIHNYMDYSSDVCYQGFTPGQSARMLNIWQIYRAGL